MKITKEHYAELETMVLKNMIDHGITIGQFIQERKQNGCSDERCAFDLIYSCPFNKRREWYDKVYQYANDDHVYTAIKKVIRLHRNTIAIGNAD